MLYHEKWLTILWTESMRTHVRRDYLILVFEECDSHLRNTVRDSVLSYLYGKPLNHTFVFKYVNFPVAL